MRHFIQKLKRILFLPFICGKDLYVKNLTYRIALHQLFHGPILYWEMEKKLSKEKMNKLQELLHQNKLNLGYGSGQLDVYIGIKKPLTLEDL